MSDDVHVDAVGEPGVDETPGSAPEAVEGELVEVEEVAAGDGAAAERDEIRDRYLRLAAEFENYKKRMAREQDEVRRRAAERVIIDLLPVADDLERAVAAFDALAADEADKVRDGVALVHRALATLLEREGVRPVAPAAGDAFDPHHHEALLSQPSDHPVDTVVDVIQKGFVLGERVIRPARVVVSAGPGA